MTRETTPDACLTGNGSEHGFKSALTTSSDGKSQAGPCRTLLCVRPFKVNLLLPIPRAAYLYM